MPLREGSVNRLGVEWRLARHHRHDDIGTLLIALHEVFAFLHRIGLREHRADAECEAEKSKRYAHRVHPLVCQGNAKTLRQNHYSARTTFVRQHSPPITIS